MPRFHAALQLMAFILHLQSGRRQTVMVKWHPRRNGRPWNSSRKLEWEKESLHRHLEHGPEKEASQDFLASVGHGLGHPQKVCSLGPQAVQATHCEFHSKWAPWHAWSGNLSSPATRWVTWCLSIRSLTNFRVLRVYRCTIVLRGLPAKGKGLKHPASEGTVP